MLTDIEIAQACDKKKITEIAAKLDEILKGDNPED